MVIWIIGLSGSGKSFFASKLKKKIKNSVIVDGDEVRKYFTSNLGYSKKDRKKNSQFIQTLCKFLERQKFTVLCPILSIFPSHQKQNRKIFKKYLQIYLRSDIKILQKKNDKNIYRLKKNVVGKDIKFPKPFKSHFVFQNQYDRKFNQLIKKVLLKINA